MKILRNTTIYDTIADLDDAVIELGFLADEYGYKWIEGGRDENNIDVSGENWYVGDGWYDRNDCHRVLSLDGNEIKLNTSVNIGGVIYTVVE